MLTSSILRIYTDSLCTNLHETVQVTGSAKQADTSTLLPGRVYWATVQVTDSVVGQSEESAPYRFYSLPDIVFTGNALVEEDRFTHLTTTTTDVVVVVEHGILYTTDPNWAVKPNRVVGNTVDHLLPNTTYYYRPWVKDEFGRTYVNTDDTQNITTSNAIPLVKITETYTQTSTTFSGRIDVYSTTTLSAVWLECESGGTTITTQLVAQTGEQPFTVEGLTPFTKYHLTAYATNTAGTGESQVVYFTTTEEEEPEGNVQILSSSASTISKQVKAVSLVKFEEGYSLVSHKVYLFDNSEHRGEPIFTYDGEDEDVANALFLNVDADTTYFVFSSAVIDGGGEPVTLWSEGVEVHTYSFIELGEITTTNTTAMFDFTVDGYSSETEIEYSLNGESWRRVAVEDPQGCEVTITGLERNTSYYLRARVANSYKEYCGYVSTTFTTKDTSISITGFTEDGQGGVDVSISITQE